MKALKDVRARTRAKNRGEDEEVEKEKTSSQGRRRCELKWRQKIGVKKGFKVHAENLFENNGCGDATS